MGKKLKERVINVIIGGRTEHAIEKKKGAVGNRRNEGFVVGGLVIMPGLQERGPAGPREDNSASGEK